METQKQKSQLLYRIKSKDQRIKVDGDVVSKGRLLIGRSESCDVIIDSDSISAIHAVLEVNGDSAKIYDMNSTNGTWIGGKKIVVGDLGPGDTFSLADIDLSFIAYRPEENLPPVLDSLEPQFGSASTKSAPELPALPETKKLPDAPEVAATDMPYVVFPLARDPKAEQSEYIFEDSAEIYPIFKYDTTRQAVEIIILFQDRVYSVDYLPDTDGTYFMSGFKPNVTDLEFPYLGKTERVPFVEIVGGKVSVHKMPGYEVLHLSEHQSKAVNQGIGTVELRAQDIMRQQKGDLQIFVRQVDAPPKIATAPLFRRDPVLRRLMMLFLMFTFAFSIGIQFIQRNEEEKEEEKKELAPERVATILYKQKLVVSKEKAVVKTEEAPKKIQTAPPTPKPIEKPEPQKPQEKPVVKNSTQDNKKTQGSKTATETRPVRKGNPSSKVTAEARSGGPASGPPKAQITVGSSKSAFPGIKQSGPVEVYKSADFSSSVNTLLAKGGTLSNVQGVKSAAGSGGSNPFGEGVATGVGSGSGVQTATVNNSMGSLTGVANGVIGSTSKGAEGLSNKTTVFTAGIPAETVVLGSMDPDIIRRILMDNLPKFRFCYQSELERVGSEVQGVIKLNFVIGASGHVSQAGVDNSSNLPGQVKRCVVDVLRGIQFPEPLGGGTVEVKQPMNFYPKRI
ncbi:MAG: AgmX/PglI C-terminal domain-containing protein [Bacteriovoracaceae bacterium]|nr:AgmX/PglI C-terminal domain-containing protein [Bacteriovoracaceae bacterium]